MGHIIGKDVYKKLGEKIDALTMRAPWNDALYNILRELYSLEEAEILVKMPYGMSNLERITKMTQYEKPELRKILDNLCLKGLVIDFWIHDEYHYMLSPMVIGIFEFTMMRTGENLHSKKWARLFHDYLHGDDSFLAANYGNGEEITIMRALPYEDAINSSEYIEVLDYEKATSIVENANTFSIGLCSCRHEKLHVGEKTCDVPLESCTSFGVAAEYLIRHNLAKEASKSEVLEGIARSKEQGLVLNADNVQRNVTYICHCCKCCCNVLLGISKHGYSNVVVTSSFLAEVDTVKCVGCAKCSQACPISAIKMVPVEHPVSKKKTLPQLDTSICLGCGVCALQCKVKAMKLVKREKRIIPPETIFEKVLLQCLEKGTLQNQIFDNPHSVTQKVMRGFLGGFLRLPPVKKALMSDMLRSSFLSSMKMGAKMLGKGWVTEM